MRSSVLLLSCLPAVLSALTDYRSIIDNRVHPAKAALYRDDESNEPFANMPFESFMLEKWMQNSRTLSHSKVEPGFIGEVKANQDCGIANDPSFMQSLNENKITGGSITSPHQFPWQVFISDTDFSFVCGGTIISNRWIVTAAHCVNGSRELIAVMGAHGLQEFEEPPGQVQTSTNIFVHPTWNRTTLSGDIALIRLPRNISISNYVRPICLPSYSDYSEHIGDQVTLTGWGRFADNITSASNDLRSVNLTVISNRDCMKTYGIITRDMICANGTKPKGTCNGDSGGPMNYYDTATGKWTLIGITSFGSISGCEKGYPNGFTRVQSYLEWIYSTIEYNSSSSRARTAKSVILIWLSSCLIKLNWL